MHALRATSIASGQREKTWLDSVRCLKWHLADVVYRQMIEDMCESGLTT